MKREDIFHVSPRGDLREHITSGYLEGVRCWCGSEEQVEEDGLLVVHKSMDRREEYELGRRLS